MRYDIDALDQFPPGTEVIVRHLGARDVVTARHGGHVPTHYLRTYGGPYRASELVHVDDRDRVGS